MKVYVITNKVKDKASKYDASYGIESVYKRHEDAVEHMEAITLYHKNQGCSVLIEQPEWLEFEDNKYVFAYEVHVEDLE